MAQTTLEQLEQQARQRGLVLRLQVSRPLGFWTLRLVVAQPTGDGRAQLLGEMKGWAYGGTRGLQLDTMRVQPNAPAGWALSCGRQPWPGLWRKRPAVRLACWPLTMTLSSIAVWCVISRIGIPFHPGFGGARPICLASDLGRSRAADGG